MAAHAPTTPNVESERITIISFWMAASSKISESTFFLTASQYQSFGTGVKEITKQGEVEVSENG